jgi:hypothetical protein
MMTRHPRGATVVFMLCTWLAGAAGGAGCAHHPGWGRGAPTEPPPGPSVGQSAEPAPDSVAAVPVVPAATRAVKRKPPERPVTSAPGDSLPVPAVPAPGDLPGERVISVDLPPAERAQLIDTTQRELEQADALVQSIKSRGPSPAGEETLRTIQTLVQASLDSTKRSEIREAAGLAHKAWILAAELSKR